MSHPLAGMYVVRDERSGGLRIVDADTPGAVLYERMLDTPMAKDLRTSALRKMHFDADTLLIAVGRMSRDGWSMERIRAEIDMPRRLVSDAQMERAMAAGRLLLAQRMALPPDDPKHEPAESVVMVDPWVDVTDEEDDE